MARAFKNTPARARALDNFWHRVRRLEDQGYIFDREELRRWISRRNIKQINATTRASIREKRVGVRLVEDTATPEEASEALKKAAKAERKRRATAKKVGVPFLSEVGTVKIKVPAKKKDEPKKTDYVEPVELPIEDRPRPEEFDNELDYIFKSLHWLEENRPSDFEAGLLKAEFAGIGNIRSYIEAYEEAFLAGQTSTMARIGEIYQYFGIEKWGG